MSTKYYILKVDLSEDEVACIDDWEFTYWPNQPKSEIVKNIDCTYSVIMEENFVPLVNQLQNLFKDGNAPESGTYLGEAVLSGKNKPLDYIYGDFINSRQGLVVSNRFLELIRKHKIPSLFTYELPLIKGRKTYTDYYYIYLPKVEITDEFDFQLFKIKKMPTLCVSEKLKEAILNADLKGCQFELVYESV